MSASPSTQSQVQPSLTQAQIQRNGWIKIITIRTRPRETTEAPNVKAARVDVFIAVTGWINASALDDLDFEDIKHMIKEFCEKGFTEECVQEEGNVIWVFSGCGQDVFTGTVDEDEGLLGAMTAAELLVKNNVDAEIERLVRLCQENGIRVEVLNLVI